MSRWGSSVQRGGKCTVAGFKMLQGIAVGVSEMMVCCKEAGF